MFSSPCGRCWFDFGLGPRILASLDPRPTTETNWDGFESAFTLPSENLACGCGVVLDIAFMCKEKSF